MAIFSRLISEMVKWRARRGPSGEEGTLADAKEKARRRGVRGKLLRTGICGGMGMMFVARNYIPRGAKGEMI